jgi:hypothetical protein
VTKLRAGQQVSSPSTNSDFSLHHGSQGLSSSHPLLHSVKAKNKWSFTYINTQGLVTWALSTRWFKYDRDDLCVNKSQFVPVIFEPPCKFSGSFYFAFQQKAMQISKPIFSSCFYQLQIICGLPVVYFLREGKYY